MLYWLQEVAIAVAKAVAEVTVDCEVQGNAYACAFGDADVRSVAKVCPSRRSDGICQTCRQTGPLILFQDAVCSFLLELALLGQNCCWLVG